MEYKVDKALPCGHSNRKASSHLLAQPKCEDEVRGCVTPLHGMVVVVVVVDVVVTVVVVVVVVVTVVVVVVVDVIVVVEVDVVVVVVVLVVVVVDVVVVVVVVLVHFGGSHMVGYSRQAFLGGSSRAS